MLILVLTLVHNTKHSFLLGNARETPEFCAVTCTPSYGLLHPSTPLAWCGGRHLWCGRETAPGADTIVEASCWNQAASPPACRLSRDGDCCMYRTSGGSTQCLTSLLPCFFLAATRGFSTLWQRQLPKPTEQTENVLHPGLPWRWVPWQTSTWVVAPGQPPTSSYFPVCSSQVLLDPLGTSFCSLLPPPLLLCKCLPMHGVCWDLGSPWLSGWSALRAPPYPVLRTLLSVSLLSFLRTLTFLCFINAGALFLVTHSSYGFLICLFPVLLILSPFFHSFSFSLVPYTSLLPTLRSCLLSSYHSWVMQDSRTESMLAFDSSFSMSGCCPSFLMQFVLLL